MKHFALQLDDCSCSLLRLMEIWLCEVFVSRTILSLRMRGVRRLWMEGVLTVCSMQSLNYSIIMQRI